MFRHILKRKEVVLDCFTFDSTAYDYAKISNAKDFIPEWWKETPKGIKVSWQEFDAPTIKACRAFKRYYETGIVIPAWGDITITLFPQGSENYYNYYCSNVNFKTSQSHHKQGIEKFVGNSGCSIKFTTPWLFKSSSKVEYLMNQPIWSSAELANNFTLLPGVVDFRYQHGTNVNYLFEQPLSNNKEVHIEALTPLAMLTPMTDEKIIIKNHLLSLDDFNRLDGDSRLFNNKNVNAFYGLYNRRKRLYDRLKLTEKCPF